MNKILIVGHPQSGFEEVEQVLHDCGMAYAQPSRREGFLPVEISATLGKVHNVAPLQSLSEGGEVQQITAGPVWHGMALDLMLGNIDQPLWGWADPQAIHWLNYWRDLDPALHFILVFDRPHSVLTHDDPAAADTPLSPELLAQRTRHWLAYNTALLHFFHRNPQRCLLVHREQVRASASSYLSQLRDRIDAPWPERLESPDSLDIADDADAPTAVDTGADPALASPTQGAVAPPAAQRMGGGDEPMALFVADALLREQPQCLALYEELQATANLPLTADDAPERDTQMALRAWDALAQQRRHLREQHALQQRLEASRQRSEQLAQERHALLEEQRRLRALDAHAHRQQITELTVARERVEQAQVAAQQENQSLLNQLKQVQQALEQQRQQEALAREQAAAKVSAAEGEYELLYAQVHKVQEELERYYLEKQQSDKRMDALQAQALQEAQARAKAAAQAAEAQAKAIAAEQRAAADHDLLSKKLHQVLADLQHSHEENRQSAQRIETLQAQAHQEAQARADAAEQAAQAQARAMAAEQQAAALAERAAADHGSLSIKLHQMQKDLESSYQEMQQIAQRIETLQAQANQEAQERELAVAQVAQFQAKASAAEAELKAALAASQAIEDRKSVV